MHKYIYLTSKYKTIPKDMFTFVSVVNILHNSATCIHNMPRLDFTLWCLAEVTRPVQLPHQSEQTSVRPHLSHYVAMVIESQIVTFVTIKMMVVQQWS